MSRSAHSTPFDVDRVALRCRCGWPPGTTRRPVWRRAASAACLLVLGLVLPALCHAHAQDDAAGFAAGLLHPVFGIDHLLAMVSVGIVSALMGGRRVWLVPLGFVLAMAIGGAAGIFQWPLPYREAGIAASVLCLGVAIFVIRRGSTTWLPMVLVLVFGICHGHAHGVEMPRSASPAYYTFGFVLSSAALHLLGVGIGAFATLRDRLLPALRTLGVALAAVGTVFLVGSVRAVWS